MIEVCRFFCCFVVICCKRDFCIVVMLLSERGECIFGRGVKKLEIKGEILIKRLGYLGSKGK